jgi:hypothetical protein
MSRHESAAICGASSSNQEGERRSTIGEDIQASVGRIAVFATAHTTMVSAVEGDRQQDDGVLGSFQGVSRIGDNQEVAG